MATATVQAPEIAQRAGRIAALDGWRGIAILLVLFDHLQYLFVGHLLTPHTGTGQHGVNIFFVLSGYLITRSLLESPGLKKFYLRRLFRLMPAAWVYLGALLLADRLLPFRLISMPAFRSCVLFYRNFAGFPSTSQATLHFWSLSMEEQFYLVWPASLILFGSRKCRWVAVAGVLVVTLWRATHWEHYAAFPYFFRTGVRADALLIGCLLALLIHERFIRALCSPAPALIALATLIYCIGAFQTLLPVYENIAIAVLIGFTVLNDESKWVHALAFRPLAWIGVISYSLYLWQEPFMRVGLPRGAAFLVPVFAVGSYYMIEKPCIRLGRRFTRICTSN